jgi:uncharacterized protein (DUF302 family)
MNRPDYGITTTLHGIGFDKGRQLAIDTLKTEGFGIVSEIDVTKTFKEKLNADFRRYTILGACNPPAAHHALSTDLFVGLFLPCNVCVFEEHPGKDDGCVTVSIVKPTALFEIMKNPELVGLATEIDARLARVVERLGAPCPEHAVAA